jgi:hypothetical protein
VHHALHHSEVSEQQKELRDQINQSHTGCQLRTTLTTTPPLKPRTDKRNTIYEGKYFKMHQSKCNEHFSVKDALQIE